MSRISRGRSTRPPLSELLPTRAAVEYSGMSARTLHRRAFEGCLTKYYVGSRLRWHAAELDALVVRKPSAS